MYASALCENSRFVTFALLLVSPPPSGAALACIAVPAQFAIHRASNYVTKTEARSNTIKVNNYCKIVEMKTAMTNAKSLGVFGVWVDMVVVVGDGVGAGAWCWC